MGTVSVILYIGKSHRYHGGVQPSVVAHLWENDRPGFAIYERGEAQFQKIGVYVPELSYGEGRPRPFAFPVTDLIIATRPWAMGKELKENFEGCREETGQTVQSYLLNNYPESSDPEYSFLQEARSVVEQTSWTDQGIKVITAFLNPTSNAVKGISDNLDRLDIEVIILKETDEPYTISVLPEDGVDS